MGLLELNYNIFYLKEISCVFDSLGDSFHHFFPWQMPSYLNSFILTVFGYNPSLHCPILATGEPWRFISVHHDVFSGNSCLATSQIFCSLPMDQSHQASSTVSCSFDCPSISLTLPAAKISMPGTNSWTFISLIFV